MEQLRRERGQLLWEKRLHEEEMRTEVDQLRRERDQFRHELDAERSSNQSSDQTMIEVLEQHGRALSKMSELQHDINDNASRDTAAAATHAARRREQEEILGSMFVTLPISALPDGDNTDNIVDVEESEVESSSTSTIDSDDDLLIAHML